MKNIVFYVIFITLFFMPVSMVQAKLIPDQSNGIYFGAFADFLGTEDGVSKQRIDDFELLVNKKLAFTMFSVNWMDGIVYPRSKIDTIINEDVFPIIRMMPRDGFDYEGKETRFSLDKIILGEFDSELTEFAESVKEHGVQVGIDFAVEPNGDWFGWSGVFNGAGTKDGYGDSNYPDGPERWRDAYRHIIDIFNDKEVTNVTWFFHPDIDMEPDQWWNRSKYYYPGDDYIDWIGFSIYGAQIPDDSLDSWRLFSEALEDNHVYAEEISNNKPFCVLEFGVTDDFPNGNKSDWLSDAFSTILNNSYIDFKAMSYWHESWENDTNEPDSLLRVDSSQESLVTFKNLLTNSRFLSNVFFDNNQSTEDESDDENEVDDSNNNINENENENDNIIEYVPIYRLYNARTGAHLYTRGQVDRDKILSKYSDFRDDDHAPAFYASLAPKNGLTPIYRLYNTKTGFHLYTRGQVDRDKILSKYSDFRDDDHAPAFYVK